MRSPACWSVWCSLQVAASITDADRRTIAYRGISRAKNVTWIRLDEKDMTVPSLHDIQNDALQLRRRNGWPAMEPHERFAYLVEEVGEVARALQNRPGVSASVADSVGEELYDVIWNACDLANILGIDLDAAAARKSAMNRDRTWQY